MQIVKGGGLSFLTDDVFLIAAVRKCAELEAENDRLRRHEVARYRTLRRDVSQIKRRLAKAAA